MAAKNDSVLTTPTVLTANGTVVDQKKSSGQGWPK